MTLALHDALPIYRAADPARDQSYFLFATTQDQLNYLRFPLGSLPKPQVREIAKSLDLAVALKPDSQDICFVPDGNYAGIVRKIRPDADEGGAIVHVDGRMLGRHKGLITYPVGQRDRKSVVSGKSVSVRVDLGGRRI